MNWSNMGTVNAVSPKFGLQIIPFTISELRVGANACSNGFTIAWRAASQH
ncbi:hypothetical protein [Ramlibacter sp.]|nr:hypothetical protein [Ramlibacter sp.]